ncbi:MAG: glycosyltransferase family 39 protein [Candidatus Kapabacteria bacterium]|nr:glycosyltransferase family 39 protein [Candidatus Kapabacteria bacterium]
MSKNYKSSTIYLLICGIILFPIIYFPYSLDLSVFALCGKTIANGGKLYVDIIDIKTPAIYYFFSFIHSLTNSNEIGLRIFDYFWQLTTVFIIRITVLKISKDSMASFFSGILYSFSYTTLNYTCTTQAESFIALPMLLILHVFLLDNKSILNKLILGILFGLVISLKITFGVIVIPFLLDIISQNNLSNKNKIWFILTVFLFALGTFLFTFTPLLDKEVFSAYIVMNKFLIAYIKHPPYDLELIKSFIKNTGTFIGENYSLVFSFFLVLGVFSISQSKEIILKFLKLNFMLFLFMIFSVVIEKKFFQYHYSRFYLFTSILCGFGISLVVSTIKNNSLQFNLFNKVLITIIFILSLFLSPISRYINILQPIYLFYTDKSKYYHFFDSKEINNCHLVSEKEVVEYLKVYYKPSEKVDVISVGGNTINMMLNNPRFSPLIQSCFFYSDGVPYEYLRLYQINLLSSDWLIFATKDIFLYKNKSSWDYLINDTTNYQYVIDNFEMVKEVPAYKVFKRK